MVSRSKRAFHLGPLPCRDRGRVFVSPAGRDRAETLRAGRVGGGAVYSERERAALTLTDAVTRITGGHVPDSVFERAQAHFNEQELIALGLP